MKTMKLIKYITIALFGVAAVSCDLIEKPTSFYESDSYFKDYNRAKMAVTGVYDVFAFESYYGQFIMPFSSSDDMYMVRGTGIGDGTRRDISHYAYNAQNTWIEKVWTEIYKGIDRANTTIAGIENMPGYSDDASLKELAARTHFARAFMAFDLVRFWGDVPFKTKNTDTFDSAFLGRVDREDIYDVIIKDLDFAKTWLPDGKDVPSSEYACKAAARAMLMRVYLQRAGYSLKMDAKLTRPDDATRKSYFDAVITEWEAIETEGYHNFCADGYEQLFKNYSELKTDNKESFWEIAFEPNAGLKDNAGYWGTYNGPLTDAPSGKEIDKTKTYGRANAFFTVLPYWQDFFEATDVRRDVSIVDYVMRWDSEAGIQVRKDVCKEVSSDMYRYPGKWRREWKAGWIEPNFTSTNYCPLRYADAVLMAAEAYNETGNTPKAWELLNRVRSRAHATPVDAANYTAFYKAPAVYNLSFIDDSDETGKFRTALYWERAFETAFEGQRKYDLIRWGILAESLTVAQNYIESWNPGDRYQWVDAKGKPAKDPKPWDAVEWAKKNYVAGHNFIKGQHELFPIPLKEIQSNAKLEHVNNPGF